MMPTVVWAGSNEENGIATQATIIPNRSYYTDENGSGETLKVDCVHLTSSITTWDQEWYFMNGGTINGDVTIPDGKTVNIIILDGTTMTINGTLKINGDGTESARLKFYGTSSSGTGKIIINNPDSSKNNGNAIVSGNGETAYIHLIGGELTATGAGYNAEDGKGAALSNVRLLSEVNETIKRTAEVKCVVTGSDPEQKVEDTQKETSVTISRCECEEKDWGYEQGTGKNDGKHLGYCNLCGYIENWDNDKNGYADCSFGGGASVSAGEAGHNRTCYCGRKETTLTPHDFIAAPTADGSGHTKSCGYCGYTPEGGSVEAHNYDQDGECTVCGFRTVARDNSGKLYGSVSDALESVNDGGTVTLETQNTSGNKEISEEVDFSRAGVTVNLVMNGYTLKNEGNSTLTVENGTLTIDGNATITQNGGSQETVSSAIRVTGGTLTFEQDVTAQGGACSSSQSPAIEVTGGSLVFKGDLTAKGGYSYGYGNADKQAAAVYAEGGVLDFQKGLDLSGGLTLTKNASLANGLTQGVFWSDASKNPEGVAVKRLSVEGAKNHKYLDELLADGHAFVDKDDSTLFRCVSSFVSWSGSDVTIVEHTHTWGPAASGDNYECTTCTKACAHEGGFSSGKCEVCGKPCPHALADQSPADYKYYCNKCGMEMVARIKYDTYLYHHYPDLASAMNAAENGQTITLLADVDNDNKTACVTGDDKTVTLDLNSHTITEGWIYVGRDDSFSTNYTSNTLKITGSGSFVKTSPSGNLTVYPGGTLDLSGWTGGAISDVQISDYSDADFSLRKKTSLIIGPNAGTINQLWLSNWQLGSKDTANAINLSGGSYNTICINGWNSNQIQLGNLLATGYAFKDSNGYVRYDRKFAEERDEQGNINNLTVVPCTAHVTDTDEGTQCIYCNQPATEGAVAKIKTEDGKNIYCSDLKTAVEKADNGDTIMLLNNVELTESLSIVADESNGWRNNLTLDLNGKTISCSKEDTTTIFTSITLTICDSSNEKTGEITQNAVYAVQAGSGGKLIITGGKFGMVYALDGSEISGGTFSKIGAYGVRGNETELHNVLANGYAFVDSNVNIVNSYEKTNAENVTVVAHLKHSGNPCDCGYPCENTTKMDDTGHCPDCGELLAQAKVTVGEQTTYSTDFRNAVQNAEEWTPVTVQLLQDVTLAEGEDVYIEKGNLTIDWNGHILSGNIYSNLLTLTQSASATLKDSSESGIGGVRNAYGAAVCVSIFGSSNVTIEGGVYSPQVKKNQDCYGQFRIKGGIFENPTNASIGPALLNVNGNLSDMLADGYTFAYDQQGKDLIDVYGNLKSFQTVYVVRHSHSDFDENDKCKCGFTCEHMTVDENNKCTICGKAIVAKVGAKGYTGIEKAIAGANGGTVKLLTDAENITIPAALTLDLNGKNVNALTVSAKAAIRDSAETNGTIKALEVSGELKIKDLLEANYSFKTGKSAWATAEQLEGQSIQNASVVQVPIRSISIGTENLTVDYGYAADNSPELTCVLNNDENTDNAAYKWYRAGEATSIADTKVYTVPTGFDAGEYKYYCVAVTDGYSVTSETVTVKINKVDPTYTAPTAKTDLSYTGTAQDLIEAGTAVNGTMVYSLTEDGEYTEEIPTGLNAGEYTVWYKVKGDTNYNDIEAQEIKVTISPMKLGTIVPPEPSSVNRIYDGTTAITNLESVVFCDSHMAKVTLNSEDYELSDIHFNSADAGKNKTVIFTVTLKNTNYTFELSNGTLAMEEVWTFENDKYVIEKAASQCTAPTAKNLTYTGAAQELVEAGITNDGSMVYSLSETGEYTEDIPTGVDAGEYTVWYRVKGDKNHNDSEPGSVKVTVNKAEASCTAPVAKNLTYTGAAQELVTAGSTNDGKIMYSLNKDGEYTENIPTGTAAANYTVWYKVEGDSNHNDTEASGVDVTIAKADAECDAPTAKNLTYTGAAQELVTAGSTNDGSLVYSLEQDGTYTTDIPTGVNAGDYKVWYKVEGDSNHKDSEPASVEVKIERRSITPKDFVIADKTYDGNAAAEITSVSFDNLVIGETLEIGKDYTVTGEFNSADVKTADKVTAAVELADSVKNYKLVKTTIDKEASIAKAESQCTALVANELTYTGEAQELVKAGSTEHGDMLYSLEQNGTYTSEIPTGVNAGDYNVWYRVIGDDNHNDSNPASVKVTVNRADAAFEAPAAVTGLEYTGEAQELVKAGNTEHGTMVYSLEQNGTYSSEIPAGVNAGDYNVWYKVTGDSNHKDSEPASVEVTVARATPAGEPAFDRIGESGKTLADANIAVKDKDGKDKFSVAGTVKWESDDTTEVKQGSRYKWIFTPESDNYNAITGEITLWPYYSGGGAAEDVITIEDKTSSETATITTVKDTKTETVKNEQGEEISKVTATVSEKVAEKLVDQAVSNKSDTVEITVKSNDGNKVDGEKQVELEIPKSAVESIAKDTDADLVIKTDSGQVVLDNRTLETIAAEAEGDTVRIVVNENTQLKETQKPALDVIGKNGKLFDIKAVIGDRVIHDFKGGRAHVTLPMPEKLKGKDVVVIYISDKGICEILNHTVETVGADEYIRFATSHFSNFAVVEKADAEKIIEQQNLDKVNSLIKEAKLKAATSKTSKKNVKIKVSVKNSNSLIKEAKAMGYTVKYKFYRSTKKSSKYAVKATKKGSTYINTKGKKGTKYYYKARVLVYDGKKLIAQTELKKCSYGARTWSK